MQRVLLLVAGISIAACSTSPVSTDPSGREPSSVGSDGSVDPSETVKNPTESSAPLPDGCQTIRPEASKPCISINAFQPPAEQLAQLDRVFDTGDRDFEFEMYGNNQSTIVVDDVPYAQYWQLEDPSQFVLHPMVVGRYIFNNADQPDFELRSRAIAGKIGTKLPNGGTAFYYPNRYPLNRMIGRDYMYSAISQSELLAGYTEVDQRHPSEQSRTMLLEVKEALFFDHAEGGVDLAGVAQLEFPLFHSNPEVILNGWLHSLLHLNDYATLYDDEVVASYVRTNLEFFVENHGVWYDAERNISRYSDTSPQRVLIRPAGDIDTFELRSVYSSSSPRLGDYDVPLVDDSAGELSGFDNRIRTIDAERGVLTTNVNCTGLFDTFIVANQPFVASVKDNGYEPERASPGTEGTWHDLQSVPTGPDDAHVVELALDDGELICGYPTNFSKSNGKNFYHMQHIVALLYLAQHSPDLPSELVADLERIAGDWYRRTDQFEPRTLSDFESPQTVLDGINRGKVLQQETDAASLFSAADVELFELHRSEN